MKNHFVGPSSQPSPFQGEGAGASGTSLVVRQWMELIRGEVAAHVPANEFRTLEVVGQARYCLRCFGVRGHDVVYGMRDGVHFGLAKCRCCGKESST